MRTLNDEDDDAYDKLKREVRAFRRVLLGVALCVCFSYFVWFSLVLRLPPADHAESWGQFGDFVGGLLNPLIAYAAFYWVTRSVLIQGKELAETRRALTDAAVAQSVQARNAKEAVRLSALQALVQAATADIEFARKEQEYVGKQFGEKGTQYVSYALDGSVIPGPQVMAYLEAKGQEIQAAGARRQEMLTALQSALASDRAA